MTAANPAAGGLLVASDRLERRVVSARRRLRRLGLDLPWLVADGRRLPFPARVFDRVLLDAPCTGLGTLRRRPEIRHRLVREDPHRAGQLQRQLLDEAVRVVRRDGLVVYAVCTVFPEETVDVVAGFQARPPKGLPGRPAGDGWLLGPHLTGSDGMFISLVTP
jgi:16S rRNA (cytosine967-C5)-methyltransferase